jgi:pectinesterase
VPDAAARLGARPILSPAEAAPYAAANYLGWSGLYAAPTTDPWYPGPILATGRPDFVVGTSVEAHGATHTTVQAAVNAAFAAGGTGRRYVKVLPGTYTGTVFIPAGTPPLTLYGAGRPADVRLEFTVDATITPARWAAQVNPSGQYTEGDPAWETFQSCATRTSATAGLCATVVWSQNPDLRLRGLTITNTLLDTVDSGTHQALALRTDADRTQLEQVRLISRQDTFYANASDPDRIARVLVRDSYIEGDTDFVFGRASALFERSRFHLVSTRKSSGGVIFAPSTVPGYPYGFLVRHCWITADEGYQAPAAPTGHLGRAWDQGAGATGYLPGVSPNGQLVIRDSYLGAGFDPVAPWAQAATTARPFAARTDPGRDLDDPAYNRLFECRNTGPSAVRG